MFQALRDSAEGTQAWRLEAWCEGTSVSLVVFAGSFVAYAFQVLARVFLFRVCVCQPNKVVWHDGGLPDPPRPGCMKGLARSCYRLAGLPIESVRE